MSEILNENDDFVYAILALDSLLQDAIIWICENKQPQEVFDIEELESWALDNGFIKKENQTNG